MKRNPFFLSVLGAAALGVLSGCSTFSSKEMATSVRQEVKSTTTALQPTINAWSRARLLIPHTSMATLLIM